MSKDEYLITDAPLKALTVFAMPMILGSFFQQVYNMADSIIVGQFVGSSALAAVGAWRCADQRFHLRGAGSRCRRRCARKPLFRRQRIRQNENHRINLPAQLFRSEHRSRSLWLWLFPRDDERTANSCRYTGGGGAVSAGLFRRLSVPVHVQYSLQRCSPPSANQKSRSDC